MKEGERKRKKTNANFLNFYCCSKTNVAYVGVFSSTAVKLIQFYFVGNRCFLFMPIASLVGVSCTPRSQSLCNVQLQSLCAGPFMQGLKVCFILKRFLYNTISESLYCTTLVPVCWPLYAGVNGVLHSKATIITMTVLTFKFPVVPFFSVIQCIIIVHLVLSQGFKKNPQI